MWRWEARLRLEWWGLKGPGVTATLQGSMKACREGNHWHEIANLNVQRSKMVGDGRDGRDGSTTRGGWQEGSCLPGVKAVAVLCRPVACHCHSRVTVASCLLWRAWFCRGP